MCKRTVPIAVACTPGKPITENDGWLHAADSTTASWDANCDGTVEKKPIPKDAKTDWSLGACEMGRGRCQAKKMADGPCGDKWAVFDKCVLVKGECKGTQLIGSVTQACR